MDLQLSEFAREFFPFAPECKSLQRIAVYKLFEQAKMNSKKENLTPLLVVKQNRSKPLAILDLDDFFKLLGDLNELRNCP